MTGTVGVRVDAISYDYFRANPAKTRLEVRKLLKNLAKVNENVHAEKVLGPDHHYSYSELEGRLEMIRIHDGKGELALYDGLTGKLTACNFKADRPEEIGKLITHKIKVLGNVKYNRDNFPVAIDVDDYEPLDRKATLLQLHEKGFQLKGKLSSSALIRKKRDMDG